MNKDTRGGVSAVAEALFKQKTQAQKMNKGAKKEGGANMSQRPGSKLLNNYYSNYIDDKVNPSPITGGEMNIMQQYDKGSDEHDTNAPKFSGRQGGETLNKKHKRTKSAARGAKKRNPNLS